MDDLISRQKAIQALADAGIINYCATGNGNGMIQAINVVKALPTVAALHVRHAKWIQGEFGLKCSDCGCYIFYRDKFDQPWESPYCPICGARMDSK